MTLTEIIAIAVFVALAAFLIASKKKKKSGASGSGKWSVRPMLPPYPKGYMSVAVHKGVVYGGTYQLHGRNVIRWNNHGVEVPAGESVYQLVPDGPRLIVCCEESSGRLFQLVGGKLSQLFSGGHQTFISAANIRGQIIAVSTDFNRGGIKVHNVSNGRSYTLASSGKFHARQILWDGTNAYIPCFDYASEQGGWYVSQDLMRWIWRPRPELKGIRPLRGVRHGNRIFFACSPYRNGQRVGPATVMEWDRRSLKTAFVAPNNHRMFFGIASDGKSIYAGTLTNWRGSGHAELYKGPGKWRRIWVAPDPEITSIWAESGTAYVATRNEHGAGRVFEIVGEPGAADDTRNNDDDGGGGGLPVHGPAQVGAGYLYKPLSDPKGAGGGRLVILLPASYGRGVNITFAGERPTQAPYPRNEDGDMRLICRFSKPGPAYPANSILEINGKKYRVPNPAMRVE